MFVTRPKWRPPKTPIAVPAVSILPDFHRHGLNNYRFFHSTPSKASAFDRRTSQEQSGNFRDAPNTPSRAVRRIIGRSSKHRDESSGDPGIRRIGLHQSDRRDGGRGNTGPTRSTDQLFSNFTKAFTDLEIELRRSRPYDGFDMSAAKFWTIFRDFEAQTEAATKQALRVPYRKCDSDLGPLLNEIFNSGWEPTRLGRILKIGLYNCVMKEMFSTTELERQRAMMDCRYPMEWFPRARLVKRVLHLHVGPTNSGKTYQALKKLEDAKVGCYAGPLRLLAQEIYSRMNARGKPTWLVTGDDQQVPNIPFDTSSGENITACTVEMIDFERYYDVAVIDEVQMAADTNRGHSWTAAIVGVPAKEVHLCGEERTVPLIQEIARSLGEELIIHRYQRLSPLAVMDRPLGHMSRLEKGDCIVCFSVMRIHAMKRYVEKMTNKRVAIIYGSLPPEVRAQQARLFNDQSNEYDFLVASDAIGMGLNLAISRVIFDTIRKRTGSGPTTLTTPEIRQIGGRAGRYKTANLDTKPSSDAPKSEESSNNLYPAPPAPPPPAQAKTKLGLVTAFERGDLSAIRRSMNTDPEPIPRFGVCPTHDMIELFCTYFPVGIPYSFILARILDISQTSSRYFFCDMKDTIEIADIIQTVRDLSIAERVKICFAPVSVLVPGHPELIKELAEVVANQTGGDLLNIKGLNFECLDEEIQPNRDYLQKLEILHKGLVLYLWMSFRFPGVFIQRPLAIKAKMLVEENIDKCLNSMEYGNIDATRLREQKAKILPFVEPTTSSTASELSTGNFIDPDTVRAGLEDAAHGERSIPSDDIDIYPELEEDIEAERDSASLTSAVKEKTPETVQIPPATEEHNLVQSRAA